MVAKRVHVMKGMGPVTANNWDVRVPDNWGGDQNCALVNWEEAGKWDDQQCRNMKAFVCQIML